ncbi:hypothetical protein D6783_04090, partial [Candidatus Woesearchaeota archaeon]
MVVRVPTGCAPPTAQLCHTCTTTCGEGKPWQCVQGYCVPDSDPDPSQCFAEKPSEKHDASAENNPEKPTSDASSEPPSEPSREPVLPDVPIPDSPKPLLLSVTGNGTHRPINTQASPSQI